MRPGAEMSVFPAEKSELSWAVFFTALRFVLFSSAVKAGLKRTELLAFVYNRESHVFYSWVLSLVIVNIPVVPV